MPCWVKPTANAANTAAAGAQGAVISPLLANIYLHPLDCLLRERGFPMVRYCDDFVVLCRKETKQPMDVVRYVLGRLELTLDE